jgi:GntR family transcriptional regulator, transcriptional repressor for pyruvate dehydrogenase complex
LAQPDALAPLAVPEKAASGAVRPPKTAELVARTLRRMVVEGQLVDGDFLPHETELMAHFAISRPTLREAVRVLESERIVEVRRGSRTGARVRVPGPEIVARPAGLLLELSAATLADVLTARVAIEPTAAGLLAEQGTREAHDELDRLVSEMPEALKAGDLARASANLHRRMVELSGNVTLGIIAGMLDEISLRHVSAAMVDAHNTMPKAKADKLLKSYDRLVGLVKARDGAEAEAHWRRHMENSAAELLTACKKTKVRDVMD